MSIDSTLPQTPDGVDGATLKAKIRGWGSELGFQAVAFSQPQLSAAGDNFQTWVEQNYHGEMAFMARNIDKRRTPAELVDNTRTIISVRMDYQVPAADSWQVIHSPELGFIARYALGRDYHKLMRKRLQHLADKISDTIGPFGYRAFVDSAPVLEKEIAQQAGLGWVGKHTNLLSREAGSWFFLGEIFTDLDLSPDPPGEAHCGTCSACIDICPTQAIIAPHQLDARLCISYLTIELRSSIPEHLRPLMGNRIYGCDDCQLVCPWNRFAQLSQEQDYLPRHGLDAPQLLELFAWDENTFLTNLEGSPIRRIGHECWLRNIAVALGNGPASDAVILALNEKLAHPSEMVREHVQWALARLRP